MVGGNTRVNSDLPPYFLYSDFNVAARGLNIVGLKRAGFSLEEIKELKAAFRLLYRAGLQREEALRRIEVDLPRASIRDISLSLFAAASAGFAVRAAARRRRQGQPAASFGKFAVKTVRAYAEAKPMRASISAQRIWPRRACISWMRAVVFDGIRKMGLAILFSSPPVCCEGGCGEPHLASRLQSANYVRAVARSGEPNGNIASASQRFNLTRKNEVEAVVVAACG